jgi:hypothetical protein
MIWSHEHLITGQALNGILLLNYAYKVLILVLATYIWSLRKQNVAFISSVWNAWYLFYWLLEHS